jgi:hypothetical protein
MSYLRFLSAAFIAVLATAGIAAAQQATPVPDVKPDFSSMKFLMGTWTCKTLKNSMGRGSGRSETDTTTMSMDGHYMMTSGVSKPFDTARTRTLTTQGWVGWDSAKKQWYSFGISNFGGMGVSTSPGWKGNTMVWTDMWATDGQPLGVSTVTKVSATKTTSVNTVKTAKGTETTNDQCVKS